MTMRSTSMPARLTVAFIPLLLAALVSALPLMPAWIADSLRLTVILYLAGATVTLPFQPTELVDRVILATVASFVIVMASVAVILVSPISLTRTTLLVTVLVVTIMLGLARAVLLSGGEQAPDLRYEGILVLAVLLVVTVLRLSVAL